MKGNMMDVQVEKNGKIFTLPFGEQAQTFTSEYLLYIK